MFFGLKKRKFVTRILLLSLIAFLGLVGSGQAQKIKKQEPIVRYYLEDDGDTRKTVRWCLTRKNGAELSYDAGDEHHITRTDKALATMSWEMEKPSEKTRAKAVRKGNFIEISGHHDGKRLCGREEIDAAPWYQATSLSLSDFVLSDREQTAFWTLRPGHFKAYKMRAKKVGCDVIHTADEDVRCLKIELRLTGFLGPFWKSTYWYRESDGAFMRFEGTTDAAGKDRIVISYMGSDYKMADDACNFSLSHLMESK